VEQAQHLLADALARGGRVLGGGRAPGEPEEDAVCRPVIVIDAEPDMALCREAAFAPIMAVGPFDTLDEALQLDLACPYALGASVFTRDVAAAEWLAARLRAGMVTVNDVIVPTAHPATPFGGRGESGWGDTQGAEGLLAMTVPQTVSVRGGTFRPHYDSATAGKEQALEEFLRAMLQATHGPGIGAQVRGWGRVIRAMWRGL
jgi:aldehyde dehydrogenase (NAD+)